MTTPIRQNAAQNRNKAALFLRQKAMDIISFFDADDVMHPQRLEFVKFAFYQNQEAKIVLHSYIDENNLKEGFEYYRAPKALNQVCIKAPSGCVIIKDDWQKPIHHSQSSVAAHITQEHPFIEFAELERREDSVFCGNVVAAYPGQNTYIENKLSKYYMEGLTHEMWQDIS